MKRIIGIAPLFLLMAVLMGCTPTQHIGPVGSPNGMVSHVVIMWLYDPGDETARNEVLAAGRTIEQIPGVAHVAAGKNLPSDRPMADHSFDIGYVISFRNADDMKHYLDSPQHQELKKNVLDRYVKKYQVYDFVAE